MSKRTIRIWCAQAVKVQVGELAKRLNDNDDIVRPTNDTSVICNKFVHRTCHIFLLINVHASVFLWVLT